MNTVLQRQEWQFRFIVKNALSGTELPEKYSWTFYAIFALLIIMLTLIIIWIRGLIKTPMKKGTRVFNIITLITLVICTANVIYWNLFVFWIT